MKTSLIKTLSLLVALVMVFAMFAGCKGKEETTAPTTTSSTGGTTTPATTPTPTTPVVTYADNITINLGAKITTFDPQAGSTVSQSIIYKLTHNQLTYPNLETDKLEPELAESWDVSADGLTYTFHLRKDVLFHNGEKLTADDVVYTMERGKASAISDPTTYKLVKSVTAKDENTVEMVLEKPNSDFPELLGSSYVGILNRKACEADPENGAAIGTGGWTTKPLVLGEDIIMTRFDDFWGWNGNPTPTKTLTLRYIPEAAAKFIAYQAGDLDLCVDISSADLPLLDQEDKTKNETYFYTTASLYFFSFNTQMAPGNDQNFRLAIAHALNYDDIITVGRGGYAERSNTMFGIIQYGRADLEPYKTDVATAKDYLAKSAYPNGCDVELTILEGNETVASIVQSQLKEIGVNVTINSLDAPGYNSYTAEKKHQVFIYNRTATHAGDECRKLWGVGSVNNRALVDNADINKLMDDAVATSDDAKRKEYYKQLQVINQDEAYYIPLYNQIQGVIFKKGLTGIIWDQTNRYDYTFIKLPKA